MIDIYDDHTHTILSKILAKKIFKRGYFLLTNKGTSHSWIDLYSLSNLFYDSEYKLICKNFLKEFVNKIVQHQMKEMNINAIIVPRWTQCTEDLFSDTLLSICVELFCSSEGIQGITVYELLNAGGTGNDFYIRKLDVEANKQINELSSTGIEIKVKAIALLALDIHTWLIDGLLKREVKAEPEVKSIIIESVIPVIGRYGTYPETEQQRKIESKKSEMSKFRVFPIFNAHGYENIASYNDNLGFSYLLDASDEYGKHCTEMLYKRLFCNNTYDSLQNRKYIPVNNCFENKNSSTTP